MRLGLGLVVALVVVLGGRRRVVRSCCLGWSAVAAAVAAVGYSPVGPAAAAVLERPVLRPRLLLGGSSYGALFPRWWLG